MESLKILQKHGYIKNADSYILTNGQKRELVSAFNAFNLQNKFSYSHSSMDSALTIDEIKKRIKTNKIVKKLKPNTFKCEFNEELNILNENELQFFIEFMKNYDIYSSVSELLDFPERVCWHDICFSTAQTVFDILKNGEPKKIKINTDTIPTLKKLLKDKTKVLHFDIDGNIECHGFTVYPLKNNKILLIQSVGDIMVANFRILDVDTFIKNLYDGSFLFGYTHEGNRVENISVEYSKRKSPNTVLLNNILQQLSEEQIEQLRKSFERHFRSRRIERPKRFIFNEYVSYPFYFVDPLSLEFTCVDKATDVPISVNVFAKRKKTCKRN